MNPSGLQMLERLQLQRGPHGLPPLGTLNRFRSLLGNAEPTALLLAQMKPTGAKGIRWQMVAVTDRVIAFVDAESEDEYEFHYDGYSNRPMDLRRLDSNSHTVAWVRPLRDITSVAAVTDGADWIGVLDEPARPAWKLRFSDGEEVRIPLTDRGTQQHGEEAAAMLHTVLQALSI